MAKSIIQPGNIRECYLCREEADKIGFFGELPRTGLHKHHFMHGTANRKKAEHFGLWAYVCTKKHHEYGPEAPHVNAQVDLKLKRVAQEAFEKKFSHEEWMQEFGKNYIDAWPKEEPEAEEKGSPEGGTYGFRFIGDQIGGEDGKLDN